MRAPTPRALFGRQAAAGGGASSVQFASAFRQDRALATDFSEEKVIRSAHAGAVLWLDLDAAERRYLLAGAADGSIAVYDVVAPLPDGDTAAAGPSAAGSSGAPKPAAPKPYAEHGAVLTIGRGHPAAHRFSVSAVAWYPIDTGLFVTGSFDRDVKVWDTNAVDVACQFQLPDNVYAVAMSHVTSAHCLIAVAGGEPQVVLCDPASGGFTHTLAGHREKVWALAWSATSEWELASGACDGQVRIWDIRRAGCLHVLDQHATQRPARSPGSGVGGGGGSREVPASFHRARVTSQRAGLERSERALVRQAFGGGGGAAGERYTPTSPAAQAHDGCVTAVLATPDGLHWVTAGTDSRVRLWDTAFQRNLLVNFANTHNRSVKGRQIAVDADSRLLFHPSGSIIQVLHLMTGRQHKLLRGHPDTVNCCCYNPTLQELYSGANDNNIVVWSAPSAGQPEAAASPLPRLQQRGAGGAAAAGIARPGTGAAPAVAPDEDAWSD